MNEVQPLSEDILMSTYTYIIELLPRYYDESHSDLANFFIDVLRRHQPLHELQSVLYNTINELDIVTAAQCHELIELVFQYINKQLDTNEDHDTNHDIVDLYSEHTDNTTDNIEHNCKPHDNNTDDKHQPASTTTNNQPSTVQPRKARPADGTALFVSNISPELHDIQLLTDYFIQYGTINYIQLISNDKAIVVYNTVGDATTALQSPQAVFNNRFITLARYTQPNKYKHRQAIHHSKAYNKSSNIYHTNKYHQSPHHTLSQPPSDGSVHTPVITAEQRAAEIAHRRLQSGEVVDTKSPQSVLDKPLNGKRSVDDSHANTGNIDADKQAALQALRQKLIQKQIQKQKDLLAKLQSNQFNTIDKQNLINELKQLNSSIKQSMNKHTQATNLAQQSNHIKRYKQ